MLQEKIRDTIRITGLAAAVVSVMTTAACGDDECATANPGITQGYIIGQAYATGQKKNYLSYSDCGPGCELIGETEDQYCCWCE